MTIPVNTLKLLEFDKLLGLIADYANSEASRAYVLQIHPMDNKDDIETRFKQVSEIRKMSHEGNPIKLSTFLNLSPFIANIKPEGAVLDAKEISYFIPFMTIAYNLSEQLRDRFDLPTIKKLTDRLTGFPEILKILKKSVDTDGNILDTASSLLTDLRNRIRKLEAKIRKKLEDTVRNERISIFLQDEFITIRSGRWVIPVRMDSKGMVPGVVHDVSKSGDTAFIEPLSIINLANELENLIAEQKAEEIRILRNICSKMREVIDGIEDEFRTIVYIDTLNCIAKFADRMNMQTPLIVNSDTLKLVRARHPLLEIALKNTDGNQRVVPLDLDLGGDNTVMVITGANAGGKTIAIKTIGLLVLMALSGLPITADSSSFIPLTHNILVDIGDEQSIENNLSTFSAHISNISGIINKADSRTIILIDELGTGTDPEEGAVLACAILKDIQRKGSLLFATTHLSEIKGYVHRAEGMINASMAFDQKTLTPLYRLEIGEPGQSHALVIAKKYGLPERIIEEARGMLGSMKIEYDHLIEELKEKRAEIEKLISDLKLRQSDIEEKNNLIQQKFKEIENRKKKTMAETYTEAADIISSTKRLMHSLLDEFRKKGKSEGRKILAQVASQEEVIHQKLMKYDPEDMRIPSIDEVKEGDIVFVRSLGYDGKIIDINQKQYRLKLTSGGKEIEVPLSDIRHKKGKSLKLSASSFVMDKPDEIVPARLNLVGLRVDEAISKLEHLLNHASLAELSELTIIHGVGKGFLMNAIHDHLSNHPLVSSFRSGTPEEGGIGVTIVKMS